MRKDICHFYQANTQNVYKAYVNAIYTTFNKVCKEEKYHTLSFGLDYSFKYNMNGGVCTVHLIPYKGGTAVDVRYTVVQLLGARYKAHNEDLTSCVEKNLNVKATAIDLDVEIFLREENKLTLNIEYSSEKNIIENESINSSNNSKTIKFCNSCGTKLNIEDKFCNKCGTSCDVQYVFCNMCGSPYQKGDKFCSKCGSKL